VVTHVREETCVTKVSHVIAYCTNASCDKSAIAEFLVSSLSLSLSSADLKDKYRATPLCGSIISSPSRWSYGNVIPIHSLIHSPTHWHHLLSRRRNTHTHRERERERERTGCVAEYQLSSGRRGAELTMSLVEELMSDESARSRRQFLSLLYDNNDEDTLVQYSPRVPLRCHRRNATSPEAYRLLN